MGARDEHMLSINKHSLGARRRGGAQVRDAQQGCAALTCFDPTDQHRSKGDSMSIPPINTGQRGADGVVSGGLDASRESFSKRS